MTTVPVPALTRSRLMGAVLAACGVAAAGLLVSVLLGPAGLAPGDAAALLAGDPVMLHARLPRVVLGALCGGALALAGAALQALMRNPLADPYVVGVSGGAALGGTLVTAAAAAGGVAVMEGAWPWVLPAGAMAGAVMAMVLLGVSVPARAGSHAVLLGGVVFNATCLAVVSLLRLVLRAETSQALGAWMLGDIPSLPWSVVLAAGAWMLVGGAWLVRLAGSLHLLAQGDDTATRLGLDVLRARRSAQVAVSLVVAAVVSVAGMVGFVGLVVPHVVRARTGPDARVLLPVSALVGAGLLPLLDGLARASFAAWNTELPVGALTALLGGPVFLLLLAGRGRRATG